jgi:Na+-driven multidrug efflux pump
MKDLEYHLNTSYTIVISYLTYYTVFGLLYYHDNKKEYLLENGKLDSKKFGRNILKIVFSVGIAEVVYVVTRWSIHYYLLTIGYEPYLTSIIAHVSSAIMFATMINLGVKATSLYNRK